MDKKTVKITWSNGDHTITGLNGSLTNEQILKYYDISKVFNIGQGERDNLVKVRSVEFLD